MPEKNKSISILRALGMFGTLFSSLSVLLLIQYAVEVKDLSKVVLHILDYYGKLIEVFFGWMTPAASWLLTEITQLFSIHLILLGHWKHIFVVMWLYFMSSSKMIWSRSGNRKLAIFAAFWGALCALTASALAASAHTQQTGSMEIAMALTIAGIASFEIGITLSMAMDRYARNQKGSKRLSKGLFHYILPVIVVGIAATFLSLQIIPRFPPEFIKTPSLIGISVYILLLTFYWFLRACLNSIFDRKWGQSIKERFMVSGGRDLSLSVSKTIITVLALLACNAGLSLAGL